MRFHNLQLLRGAAALGVVVFHLGVHGGGIFPQNSAIPWLRSGWWVEFPVPLFFALSGFVLTHALQTTPRSRFLLGRFLRLYPGYWLAMGLGLAIVWRGVWPLDQQYQSRFSTNAFTLVPGGGKGYYVLGGVEWSLIYEVMLSVSLTVLSLLGPRRGLAIGVVAWLAVLVAKVAVRPGFATEPFPHWQTVLLSAYSVPFLLGVLAYHLRDYGRRWRWVVFAALVGIVVAVVPRAASDRELHWCAWGVAGAGAVWFAVQVRQVSERNPLARLGDCTYGLYLVHVPVMLAVYYRSVMRQWDMAPSQVILVAGAAATVVGLLFGRFESALHARLRPLMKLRLRDARAWPGHARAQLGRLIPRPRFGSKPPVA